MKGMQKISRGRGFRGALDYAFKRDSKDVEAGRLLGGNMDGLTPAELSSEFAIARQVRPDIKKPVWHNSLRLPIGEKLNDENWDAIADDYMRRMGFTELHQRSYVLHDDANGQHIHIIASRISLDGTLYLGKNENLISTRVIQQLEHVHNLTITKGIEIDLNGKAVSPEQKKLSKGEQELGNRLDKMPPKERLQKIIDHIITEHLSPQQGEDNDTESEQNNHWQRATELGFHPCTRPALPKSDVGNIAREASSARQGFLRGMSNVAMAQDSGRHQMLLQGDAHLDMDDLEAVSNYALRRGVDSKRGELTATQFADALAAFGVKYKAHIASTGRLNGFSFEVEGVSFSGSQLGKGYAWLGLQKRGLSYDAERDRDNLVVHVAQTKEPQEQTKPLFDAYRSFLSEQQPSIEVQRKSVAIKRGEMVQRHQKSRTALALSQRERRREVFEMHRHDPVKLKIEKMLLAKRQADGKAELQEKLATERKALVAPKIPDFAEWLATQEVTLEQQKALEAEKRKAERKRREENDEVKDEAHISSQIGSLSPLKPAPADIRNFNASVDLSRGAVEYRSAAGTLSFTDIGHKINIEQQRDPDVVLASLQLAVQKYGNGQLTITGDADFKRLCVSLAATHGFKFVDDSLNKEVLAERDRPMVAAAIPADVLRGEYRGTVHSVMHDAVFVEVRRGYLRKLPMDESLKQVRAGERFQIKYKDGMSDVKRLPQKSKDQSRTHQ